MSKLAPKIYIKTNQYFHSRHPRGYGNWGFEIAGAVHFFIGKYSQAKKEAIAKAKEVARENERSYLVITLLP